MKSSGILNPSHSFIEIVWLIGQSVIYNCTKICKTQQSPQVVCVIQQALLGINNHFFSLTEIKLLLLHPACTANCSISFEFLLFEVFWKKPAKVSSFAYSRRQKPSFSIIKSFLYKESRAGERTQEHLCLSNSDVVPVTYTLCGRLQRNSLSTNFSHH